MSRIAQTIQSWYTSNNIPKPYGGNIDSISVLLKNEKKTKIILILRASILLLSKRIEILKGRKSQIVSHHDLNQSK